MKLPKIKLCWNGSMVAADWRFGLFGGYARSPGGRRIGWVISLRGVVAWLSVLLVLGYFSGALALWVLLERRPYNYVTYTDLILPTRWSGIGKLRGQAQIAEGLDDIKSKRWGAGVAKLRVGIARNPDEIKGRLVLAELYLAMKASKQAMAVYDGGLQAVYPGRDYVEAMIKVAAQSEDFEWWLRTCDQALAKLSNNPALAGDRRWLIQEKLRALIAAERPAEALALAEAEGESRNPAISELRVLALLSAHKPGEAVSFLRDWAERVGPNPDAQILRLQVRASREAGDLAAMGQALETLRQLAPTDPRPYVYGIVQRVLAGQHDEARRVLDSFFLRFGSTAQYLQMLAAPLAEIAERDLIEQVIVFARQQGFELTALRRSLVQSLISRGDWRDASGVLSELAATSKKDPASNAWYELMNAQIQAALDPSEGTQSNLVSLVRGRQFPLSLYKSLVGNLQRAGRLTTARELITFAQGVYPKNTVLESMRKELDTRIASDVVTKERETTLATASRRRELDTALAAAVARPPSPPKLPPLKAAAGIPSTTAATAVREVLGEADFFKRLDVLSQEKDFAGALQSIRDLRRAKPAWLSSREEDLSLAEVRLNGRAGDSLALRSVVRRYLTGDRLRGAQVIEVARELHTSGLKDEALLVLRELVAKMPDYRVAQNLLAEWGAKPPAQQ
ncbi:MAG: hypothetical protein H2172_03625 [Opitutus sp.]|nr:hypothetical protein [Opitutus sp.]MCS6246295.1 hypothetical protein [Opitutus sp.]MCS6273079.1 hypothetical protein [Opitutus sp.]MCS6277908.1 hypothetical protein [Opitutus sp.]MCS6298985.1 hypothetical protein [Opitutus sp.]